MYGWQVREKKIPYMQGWERWLISEGGGMMMMMMMEAYMYRFWGYVMWEEEKMKMMGREKEGFGERERERERDEKKSNKT
jgi:hypothetical protein